MSFLMSEIYVCFCFMNCNRFLFGTYLSFRYAPYCRFLCQVICTLDLSRVLIINHIYSVFPSSGSGMYFRIVRPLNDISTHFMTDIWSWLDLHLLTAWRCVSTLVLIKCSVAVHMHGELWLLVWNIRNSVYYEGDAGWHGSGLCQKLSAKVWAWMGGNRDHLVNFSTAGSVLTFILLGWVTFCYQQLIQIFVV
jgi:hypothetical protein